MLQVAFWGDPKQEQGPRSCRSIGRGPDGSSGRHPHRATAAPFRRDHLGFCFVGAVAEAEFGRFAPLVKPGLLAQVLTERLQRGAGGLAPA